MVNSKYKEKEHVWVVMRFDRFVLKEKVTDRDVESAVSVKEIVTTEEIAQEEVKRLNHINADKDVYYWYCLGRLFPEGSCSGPVD